MSKLTNSYTLEKWLILRNKLRDKLLITDEWKEVIQLLKERIYERYFDPLKILIDNSNHRGEGFTILTIECCLIEFLATLEDGRIFKRNKLPSDKYHYYKKSSRIYQKFLSSANIFDTYFFASSGQQNLFSTQDFYLNVRCALLHEAQTRNQWEVKIYRSKLEDNSNTICFEENNGKKVIYRTALFKALVSYFSDLIDNQLVLKTQRGQTLRKHLARKIDHIAEIPPDNKYWWN